jgi:phosphate transport system substrate-binding protein
MLNLSRRHILLGVTGASLAALCGPRVAAADARVLRLGGTGTGLGVQRRLGAAFMQQRPSIAAMVLPSTGSTGGIRAVADGAMDIAFSGRLLTAEEQKLNLITVPVLRTPVVVITSHPTVTNVTHEELAEIFSNRRQNWADGMPIRVILRPKSESTLASMAEAFPDVGRALEVAHNQRELPVATTDQDNFALAEQLSGSLSVALQLQYVTEPARIRALSLDGVAATPKNWPRDATRAAATFIWSSGATAIR